MKRSRSVSEGLSNRSRCHYFTPLSLHTLREGLRQCNNAPYWRV
ncbi:MAG: hypothetical protein ACR9NN_06375 [Nostochopsis sp.]